MLRNQPILHLARVTVEAASPLSIATGRGAALFDVQLATCANGLPTIPGTSLAGVLRHALHGQSNEDTANKIFGFAQGNNGAPSAFSVTWGHIHDSQDTPVDGLDLNRSWAEDTLLKPFARAALPHRDHVRLGHFGSAAERGKFDRCFVPAGHRFSFEMSLSAGMDNPLTEQWDMLLALLNSTGFRLGGSTRRGYGQLKLVRMAAKTFNLIDRTNFDAYCKHPRRLDLPHALGNTPVPPPSGLDWLNYELALTPEDSWRFGGGKWALTPGKTADALPYTEERLEWNQGQAQTRRVIVVPASGIKGALAHRLAYHYNRLSGHFADNAQTDYDPFKPEENPAVKVLFGYAKVQREGQSDAGQVGAVLIEDAVLPLDEPKKIRLAHNSIDRYTGGVRNGVLFTEEALLGGAFTLKLAVKSSVWTQTDENIRQAFRDALEDLAKGRLALGAASAKGHGVFVGTVKHTDLQGTEQ